ncbi:DotA/TraY family protein [Acetobacter sicerae]|uniref:DotA/TraY family protein n=1 Tax=Acetobacter sicerae TaxID=85325 RepID=UPI001F54A904|nr:DotA/TraY family protein [Acetobacter sicerae]
MIAFRRHVLALLTLLCLSAAALPAMAQTVVATGSGDSSGSTSYNVTWDLLDPGDDWAAQVIRSVFPVFGQTTSAPSIGNEATVIGTMIGWFSGFVMAFAMAVVSYIYFMNIHRGAETSQLLGNNQTSMSIVRIGVAAVLMWPLPTTGFNAAQAVVVQGSLWGIGMAKVVYDKAKQAIGPDGKVIAQPLIPGTKGIVTGLVKNEFCRALLNIASNNTSLIVAPTGQTVLSVTGGSTGIINYSYDMAAGTSDGTPVCGSVSLQAPNTGVVNLAGFQVDQAGMQRQVLDSVLLGDIRGQVEQVAQSYWETKKTSSLAPLMAIIVKATNDYTSRLTTQAAQLRSKLQDTVNNQTLALHQWGISTNGDSVNTSNQMDNLGWTGAGAYYLEFARLNGQTLSLMTATPTITTPSYSGIGSYLASDIAPLVQSADTFMENIDSMVATQDGMSAPGGNADLYSGAIPGGDGAGVLNQLFRALHLNDYALQIVTGFIEPSGTDGYWTDPFGNLMSLGNWMITTSLITMGTASILSSTAGTIGIGVTSLLSGNPGGALAAGAGHALMHFFGAPIIGGCLAMLMPGLTIAYVIPMIPFVMWMFAVAGWLIMVCESVIAAPLWMLAHMTMNGEGLHGHAKQGYALLFNVIFRPVLMLFGLFLGYFIFDSVSWLIHMCFGIAAGLILSNGWIVTNFLGMIVLVSLFVMIHVTLAFISFRMISILPQRVPAMIGFGDVDRVDIDQFSRDAAVVGMAGTLMSIQQSLNTEDGKKAIPHGPNNGIDTTMKKIA